MQDSIGGPLKLGLLNTLGKIDVTLDCSNGNHADENVPEAEASKSVMSEHIACSPDATLGLKGLSPIPSAGLGDGGSAAVYGRAGGSFNSYDVSLLDRLNEFQQKPKQAGEMAPAGQAQSAGVEQALPKKVTSASDAACPSHIGPRVNFIVLCCEVESKVIHGVSGKAIGSDAAEPNGRLYSSVPKSSTSPSSSRTLWSELKQLPLCMDDFQSQSSQTLYHLAEVTRHPKTNSNNNFAIEFQRPFLSPSSCSPH